MNDPDPIPPGFDLSEWQSKPTHAVLWSADHGNCWTCGKPRCYGPVEHIVGRLRWAATTARHAKPKTLAARLRLLWHDFVIHGLLHRGGERCQDCGRDYADWRANDAEWQRVMGGPSGLLCASCFEVRCDA